MADTVWFKIETGAFALALVNTAASGYLESWDAPSGKTITTVTLADYAMPAGSNWQCQVVSGEISASSNTTREARPATWCNAASESVKPGLSSWTLNMTFAQDPQVATGLQQFLFANETKQAYFLLGLNGDLTGNPRAPLAIGRVSLAAESWGGPAGEDLTADVAFELLRKPQIEFGLT